MRLARQLYEFVLLAMLITTTASVQAQTSVRIANYRDLIRFTIQRDVAQIRLKIIRDTGQEIFDSGFSNGNSIDWRRSDRSRRRVDSGSYSYVLTTKDRSGNVMRPDLGQIDVDQAGENLIDAPPVAVVTASPHSKEIHPTHAGAWDVDHGTQFYTINTPRMGLGTQNPL